MSAFYGMWVYGMWFYGMWFYGMWVCGMPLLIIRLFAARRNSLSEITPRSLAEPRNSGFAAGLNGV